MSTGWGRFWLIGLVVAVVGCEAGDVATTTSAAPATASPVAAPATPCPTPTGTVPSAFSVPGDFGALEPTTYWVDPDFDSCTPLRVLYTIPAEGWQAWTGAFKETGDQRVGVSIVTVTNLVVDGCADHGLADPPVGPTVDDLATALADLPPFVVTSPPSDVTIYGYSGKHLELAVPEIEFTDCVEDELISWDAPILSYPFHGYLPRLIEEFWILDVQGSRVVIVANWTPDSTPENIGEMRALLDSIQIEP